jgi:hypothetical protein
MTCKRFVSFGNAEHFQRTSVFFGYVSDNVRAVDIALRPIPLGEIDQLPRTRRKEGISAGAEFLLAHYHSQLHECPAANQANMNPIKNRLRDRL